MKKQFFMTTISRNLKRLRENNTKYDQREIADILGIKQNTYSTWESGETDVKSEYIPKIAEIFGVEIKDLFENNSKKIEVNFSKQIHKGSSTNNSVVIVMPDKESVDKLVNVLKEKFEK